MAKWLTFSLLLAFASAGAQEFPNGGFEQDLTDWNTGGDRDMTMAIKEAARTGQLGVRVTDESDGQGSSVTSLPMEALPGTEYELTWWGRGGSGSGGVGVYLRFLNEAGKGTGKDRVVTVPAEAKEWKAYSVKGTAPESAVSVVVWIHSYAKDTPVVDLDDFVLKAVPTN